MTVRQTDAAGTTRRRYESPRRLHNAAQTRAAVLDAAIALFSENGWAGTGMRDVARVAGVAVETVYSNFGSKTELLLAAIDVSVVGDTEAIPLAERPEFAALGHGSRPARERAAARLVRQIHERTAGIGRALREAAAGDAELAKRLAEAEERRRMNVDPGRASHRRSVRSPTPLATGCGQCSEWRSTSCWWSGRAGARTVTRTGWETRSAVCCGRWGRGSDETARRGAGRHADDGHRPRRAAPRPRSRDRCALDGSLPRRIRSGSRSATTSVG